MKICGVCKSKISFVTKVFVPAYNRSEHCLAVNEVELCDVCKKKLAFLSLRTNGEGEFWFSEERNNEMQDELKQIADNGERKGFFEAVREAYEFALQEGIRANMLLIDKDFAKVSGVHMSFQGACGMHGVSLPPMILGLEARIAPLPEGFGIAVTEVTETERDKLYAEAKAAGRREVIEQLKEFLFERGDEDGE